VSDQIPESSEIPQGLEDQGPPDHQEYIPPAPVDDNNNVPEPESNQGDPNSQGTSEPTGHNPNWNPLLEKLPNAFHDPVKEYLGQFDKNFERVQSQYAPYKPFIERNIAPEAIDNSLKLAQLISSNPRVVYDQLAARFGFNSGQGQQEVEDDDEDNEDNSEQQFANPMDDPRLKPIIESQQQMQAYLQQQQQMELERQTEQQIAQEWQSIEKKHGSPIPQDVKAEMIRRAIWIADEKGTEPNLIDGYNDYNQFVMRVRGQKANNTAPQVFNGNGGVPSAPSGITGDMTEEQRLEYIARRAEALAKNQNS